MRLFWPEQVVVLGLFGYQAYGPTWPVVFLMILGVMARVLALGAGLLRFLRRPGESSREASPHGLRTQPAGTEHHG